MFLHIQRDQHIKHLIGGVRPVRVSGFRRGLGKGESQCPCLVLVIPCPPLSDFYSPCREDMPSFYSGKVFTFSGGSIGNRFASRLGLGDCDSDPARSIAAAV